jgi:dTDP-4-amino-4,6-dideoxygalactose transaminase
VAAPISVKGLFHGLVAILTPERYLNNLEREIKGYFKVRHVFFVSSGKAALFLILQALKSLSPRTEVLIPAYTCFSVPSVIVKAGLKVRLCDIDPSTLDFDHKLLEEAIAQDTLCVIPNHLFGIPSDLDRIRSLCQPQEVFVVEDTAQAMGGSYQGRRLGTLGDVGFLSLGRGKNITCGSGGIIVTNSSKIAAAVNSYYTPLKNPGLMEDLKEFLEYLSMAVLIHPALYWLPAGMPFLKLGQTLFYRYFPVRRMSGMKAGFLRDWQYDLEWSNRLRAETAADFRKSLPNGTMPGPSIPYLRLPVFVGDQATKDRICWLSEKQGLGISPMYPTAIHEIDEIKETFNGKDFPSAKKMAEGLLTIPTHHLLSERDKAAICELFGRPSSDRYASDETDHYH